MLRSHNVWLFGVALTLLSFGSGAEKVSAQTVYPFEAFFESETSLEPIAPNVFRSTDIGRSNNAPYDLTNFINVNYSQFDPNTGGFVFVPDAREFGVENLPIGTVTFFGNSSNRLFGTISGNTSVDFQNFVGTSSGTITITGGEGLFSGATGELSFLENVTVSPDPTAPFRGEATIRGSIQAVPEPRSIATLVGVGAIATNFLLRRRNRKALFEGVKVAPSEEGLEATN